ncbi:MAG: site-specific integrase, partial [Candidatus Acidiferrales bacterium]
CKKLADVDKDHRTKASVAVLADKILAPINSGCVSPESSLRVADFIQNFYLPQAAKSLRPSTVKDYAYIFEDHLRRRLGEISLRDFRTVIGQRLMASINGVGHKRLLRIKSFLSGVFTHAKREGILDGENPMRGVSVQGRPTRPKMPVYEISEIEEMLTALPEPAHTVVAVAAFTGLRVSELRGLRWEDFDGESLHVRRSVWRRHVGATKTPESEASVPVLPFLKKALEKHRNWKSDGSYIFAGEKFGAPLNLANLARRVIKPAIKAKGVEWKGWHAFRRGLASNLYALGVQPKVIQAILRHSDIGTTLAYYVATPDEESRAALRKIENSFVPWTLL